VRAGGACAAHAARAPPPGTRCCCSLQVREHALRCQRALRCACWLAVLRAYRAALTRCAHAGTALLALLRGGELLRARGGAAAAAEDASEPRRSSAGHVRRAGPRFRAPPPPLLPLQQAHVLSAPAQRRRARRRAAEGAATTGAAQPLSHSCFCADLHAHQNCCGVLTRATRGVHLSSAQRRQLRGLVRPVRRRRRMLLRRRVRRCRRLLPWCAPFALQLT
jgi:hypothetical protein